MQHNYHRAGSMENTLTGMRVSVHLESEGFTNHCDIAVARGASHISSFVVDFARVLSKSIARIRGGLLPDCILRKGVDRSRIRAITNCRNRLWLNVHGCHVASERKPFAHLYSDTCLQHAKQVPVRVYRSLGVAPRAAWQVP